MTTPTHHTDLPDAPPPEVLDAVDAAWERASRNAARGLELDVRVGRIGGRVRGRVSLEDEVLLRLGPAELLAFACGDPLPRR
ncbi:MAG: hypothetical protein ACJ77E_13950 [Gaiellaceae bacterium]